MIQDDELVGNGNIGSQQIRHRMPDSAGGEIAPGVVFATDDKDSGMMSLRLQDKIVKVFKVMVVAVRCTGSSAPSIPMSRGRRTSCPAFLSSRTSNVATESSSR